jgi:hypothetical protein
MRTEAPKNLRLYRMNLGATKARNLLHRIKIAVFTAEIDHAVGDDRR